MWKSEDAEREQFYGDMATVRYLRRWVYPTCEQCHHEWWRHRSHTNLPLPAYCSFADCPCGAPAHIIHEKRLAEAMKDIFG